MENNEILMNEKKTEEEVAEPAAEVKYVDKSTLVITEQCIAHIKFKPVGALVTAVVFGALFVLLMQPVTVVLGLFILAFTLFVFVKVKDYNTLSIYPDYVLVYQYESNTMVRKIMYDEVEEWTAKDNEGKSNTVMFKLKTGEVIYKDTFQSSKAFNKLKNLMGDKESRVVAHRKMVEKNKKMKTRFKLPFKWPFGNKK